MTRSISSGRLFLTAGQSCGSQRQNKDQCTPGLAGRVGEKKTVLWSQPVTEEPWHIPGLCCLAC